MLKNSFGKKDTTESTSNDQTTEVQITESAESIDEPEETEKKYILGEAIETDLFKITPSFSGFAKELANWPDESFMTPNGDFVGATSYAASEGEVVIFGEIAVEYTGNEKEDVELKLEFSADYDNGYVYDSFYTGYCSSLDGDWEYSSEMTFKPLNDTKTRILRYCAAVPEEFEQNTDKAFLMTVTINGEDFIFDFRSAEDIYSSDYDPRADFYQPLDDESKAELISYLKSNTIDHLWYYGETIGNYAFTFADGTVSAVLPINDSYQYDFSGSYEVYSGTIYIMWDHGEDVHIDYTFDGTTFDVVEMGEGR